MYGYYGNTVHIVTPNVILEVAEKSKKKIGREREKKKYFLCLVFGSTTPFINIHLDRQK